MRKHLDRPATRSQLCLCFNGSEDVLLLDKLIIYSLEHLSMTEKFYPGWDLNPTPLTFQASILPF